ncbi:hypothetical protein MEQU1_001225 [Malassezia equina]|uniref:non-specific serine/threonine protein kinase n=1 Tax=Malassezia equina TaxID=1381935 RepID=A0AAF0IZJ1_9BASI|nr:hypothetical protein MEQU1_001225 [Malassezia equina]
MKATGEAWSVRHARLRAMLHTPEVMAAVTPLSAYAVRHAPALRVLLAQLPLGGRDEGRLGRELDCALTLLWATGQVPRHIQIERTRAFARTRLEEIQQASLQTTDFTTQCTLQHGATGTVEIVRCRMNRQLYVLKTILKGVARREDFRFSPVFESQLLAQGGRDGSHYAYTPELLAAFQSVRSVHMVMEYFPAGDLDALLQAAAQADVGYPGKSTTGGLLHESWVVRYAMDMVAALGWLHALQFVHRDVKPSNFLLHRSGRLKLCDFATCAPFRTFDEQGRRVLAYYTKRPAGTCDYIAPEVLRCEEERLQHEYTLSPASGENAAAMPDTYVAGAYGPAVDWWSLGVVLYEMTFGRLPFWAPQPADVYAHIAHHEQHFELPTPLPCSAMLADLICSLVCTESQRLGRHSTADVQAHPALRDAPWHDLTQRAPPFVPDLGDVRVSQVSVLHSPGVSRHDAAVGLDSVTLDTPPSFSAMYQGPLDQFPAFEASDVSWAPDASLGRAVSPPASSPQPQPESAPREAMASPMTGPPPSPLSPAACADLDTHFCAFSFLPEAQALAPPKPPLMRRTSTSPPATSTPFGKAISPIPSPSPSNEQSPEEMAQRVRASMMHTPFKSVDTSSPVLHSPYPFPPPVRPLQAARSPLTLVHSTMGADSRHSGGSTSKRSVSERQAWAEMMDAVERSVRKPRARDAPPRLSKLRPMTDERAYASSVSSDEESSSSDGSTGSIASSPSTSPALRHRASCREMRRSMNDDGRCPELRQRRSMRQLRLDAQVTSTPTRAARSLSILPSDVSGVASSSAASPPRGHTLRTLRGSASVRDFRTEYVRLETESLVLPTIAPPLTHVAQPRTAIDSRRTLSEYRRAPRTLNESEDAFGRRTSLTQPPMTRRMQSSLGLSGLYRQGRASMLGVPRAPSVPSVPETQAPSPPPHRDALATMASEQAHIEDHVSSLERELRQLRTRVDRMPL